MIDETPTAGERRRLVTEEAATWLLALRRGRLSLTERRELVDWLRESPVHIAEMLCVSQMDRDLENFRGWAGMPADKPAGENVVRLMSERLRPPPPRARFLTASRAIAAGLVLGVLAAGGWLASRTRERSYGRSLRSGGR
ncbi:MAG: FecR/PupR family sigma factor regulator [Gammaproteobacteria bacterium]|nr:FecR/PupR family sigma factor regulator [Gammaproteobacteria bacterium]